jgi:hypothetical protein
VELRFSVDGDRIELSRNAFTGRCTLNTGTEDKVLDSPWNPLTHFSFRLKKQRHCSIKGHDIIIEKKRSLFFSGFRPQTYRIFVDGELVQERQGF